MKYRMEYDGLDRIALLWGSCQRKVSEVIGRTYFFQIFENSIINGRTETHNVLFSDSNSSSVKPARTTTSKPSDGEFSEWLRFSGLPNYESTVSSCQEQPLTLSDITPPPDQLRLISEASTMDWKMSLSSSRSMRSSLATTCSCSCLGSIRVQRSTNKTAEVCIQMCPTSGLSFAGLDSFDGLTRLMGILKRSSKVE